jgi:hypothetical protein
LGEYKAEGVGVTDRVPTNYLKLFFCILSGYNYIHNLLFLQSGVLLRPLDGSRTCTPSGREQCSGSSRWLAGHFWAAVFHLRVENSPSEIPKYFGVDDSELSAAAVVSADSADVNHYLFRCVLVDDSSPPCAASAFGEVGCCVGCDGSAELSGVEFRVGMFCCELVQRLF